jgi:ribosomal protein L3 glutamine methyltransferase
MPPSSSTSALLSVRDLVRWGASRFSEAGLSFGHGTDNALDEAFHLVLRALHLPPDLPAIYLESRVTPAERTAAVKLLRARIRTRKPAAYLLGEIEFCGLGFAVDERVLIPRSPIAELIEQRFSPWLGRTPERILDLAELSPGALAVCRQNLRRHACGNRVRVLRSDLFDGLGDARYDLIVSNPPYVPSAEWKALPAEFRHEPRMALEAGADGMSLVARILAQAPAHLQPGGLLVCEVGGSTGEFTARWPRLPVTWVDFERGGDGVFVITREDLEGAL